MPAAAVAAVIAGLTVWTISRIVLESVATYASINGGGCQFQNERGLMKTPLAAMAMLCLFVGPGAVCERSFSGLASYYSNESGSRTASGERFNDQRPTAAHRCLPFGTRLRVSRSGRSVVVTVNDRGPFVRRRVLDLALAPARELGLVGPGVAHVDVEVVD